MRVFAGPNGSGKTTIFKGILADAKIQLGVYVNADDIEKELISNKSLAFKNYQLSISQKEIREFFRTSNFSPKKRDEPNLWTNIDVSDNVLFVHTRIDSYLAADIAEFIRQQLLTQGKSFTYETVMSHPGKIDFFHEAQQNGFNVYLYYIATEDPEINISRVKVRVAQDGHAVSPEVLINRYHKSLQNLKSAIKQTKRAYVFDNSQMQARLIAEITDGIDVRINEAFKVPGWVQEYLLN